MECGIKQLGGAEAPGCLVVGKPVSLTAVDLRTGEWGAEYCCHTGDGATCFPSDLGGWGRQRDMTCWYMNNGRRVFILFKTLPEPLAGPLRSACSLSLALPKAGLCCGGLCQPLYHKNNFSTAFETGEAVTSYECYFILSAVGHKPTMFLSHSLVSARSACSGKRSGSFRDLGF